MFRVSLHQPEQPFPPLFLFAGQWEVNISCGECILLFAPIWFSTLHFLSSKGCIVLTCKIIIIFLKSCDRQHQVSGVTAEGVCLPDEIATAPSFSASFLVSILVGLDFSNFATGFLALNEF